MKLLKWLKRQKISKIYVLPGDRIQLKYNGKTVLHTVTNDSREFDEAGIFEGKAQKKDVLGSVFIGKKYKTK